MLHHVSLGVRDVQAAAKFYDAVLEALGYRRIMEFLPYAIGYGDTAPAFWVQLPHNQQPASVGNGVHISFIAASEEAVQRFHAAALANGGGDNGAPGTRPDYGPDYYGAFVLDPDGNKIEATLRKPSAASAPSDKEQRREAKRARKATAAASGGEKKSRRREKKQRKEAPKRAERRKQRKSSAK